MGDIKWEDVSHMYINSGIVSQEGHHLVECREGQNLWQYHDEDVRDFPFELPEGDLPILRHRDDMTEAEAMQLCEVVFGEGWVDDGALDYLTHYPDSKGEMLILDLIGNRDCWHWLISNGFDVFGLIESGEAIRKETARPDNRTESHC